MPKDPSIKKVLVIGSGPIIIGQAAEFDYSGTQACRALKSEGIEVVLVNSNPATIMTCLLYTSGMVGYEETLTDPSYYGQIITQTYPLVGNYGVNGEDAESARIWAFGYIVRELCGTPSNFRCQKTLDEFLKEQGIIGIAGVDTRRLTRIIRESGVMNGALTTEYKSADAVRADAALMEKIKAYTVKDAVDSVTAKCMETFNENGKYHVALFDFGYKRNILRNLVKRGCKVTLVPGRTTAAELAALEVDGVMLSNGPGDPAENVKIDGYKRQGKRPSRCWSSRRRARFSWRSACSRFAKKRWPPCGAKQIRAF